VKSVNRLVVVLGDQLDAQSSAFDGFDPAHDAVLISEVREEATYVPQHKLRLAFFFSAMRHFRDAQVAHGRHVIYRELDAPDNRGSLVREMTHWANHLHAKQVVVVEPGDWRVRRELESLGERLDIRPDRHFLCSSETFAEFARDHEHLLLESFYRKMRRDLDVLMTKRGTPEGGAWNFDKENRVALRGEVDLPSKATFSPDEVTAEVLKMVQREFADSPGRCDHFNFPVTPRQARRALQDFVTHRLGDFGRYQDAMKEGEPFLFHSHLSGPLNLHFLHPREVLDAVLENPAKAPLNSVEGYVRQLIGWREYVRGVYQQLMPDYADENELNAQLSMPRFYWTGETEMHCLEVAIGHTIEHAYAHHIERLMVLGLFALLLGVRPYDVHRWHMSMFWDAIDWVSLPNVIGMSQHADGGRMATKPYAASGQYINRMSDYCKRCRFDPKLATGPKACPFTTLYWDFLDRHKQRFAHNQRMAYVYQHLNRKTTAEMNAIRHQAEVLKSKLTAETFL
jgi:deoxyribodipyrimidine photolyase-related protein